MKNATFTPAENAPAQKAPEPTPVQAETPSEE